MLSFPRTLAALDSPDLHDVLREEINALDPDLLPLQQGLTHSSHVLPGFSARLLKVTQTSTGLQVKAGLLYAGLIAGCNCADDPSPANEITEYCEVLIDLDIATGAACVGLLEA